MNITKEEREELKELSRMAFGSTSRWQSILKRGRWDGNMTHLITVREIKDTMLHLIKQREEYQFGLRKEIDKRSSDTASIEDRAKENTESTDVVRSEV